MSLIESKNIFVFIFFFQNHHCWDQEITLIHLTDHQIIIKIQTMLALVEIFLQVRKHSYLISLFPPSFFNCYSNQIQEFRKSFLKFKEIYGIVNSLLLQIWLANFSNFLFSQMQGNIFFIKFTWFMQNFVRSQGCCFS